MKGKPYSKIVQKGAQSLEGQTFQLHVAETYVPIIRGSRIAGVFEIYLDVTATQVKLKNLMLRSHLSLFGTALGLLVEQFGIESSDEYSAAGSTDKSDSLVTTISAEVVEVLPNGNLYIEARRSIIINDETQMVVLSGVIRPRDITGSNTIPSNKMANAQITYTGRGPIARRQRPGILNKIFNWIF